MQITLKDLIFDVEVVRKNNKNMYFRFKDDVLYVTCGHFVSERQIRNIIIQNEDSLYRMYKKVSKRADHEAVFSYLGKPCVKVFDESVKKVYLEDGYIYAKNERMFDKWYKEECLRVFEERIKMRIVDFDNIPKFSLRIRCMKSRWGVNNVTKKIITLNSELLKKDPVLIDYVIVHELCHFYEANHSDRFWYQVSLRYPDYKLARKELRE